MLGLAHVLDQLDRPFDHLHVSGYTLLDPSTTEIGRAALKRARELGRSTSVDVCSVAPLAALTPAAFMEAVDRADFFFANEEEALALSVTSDVAAAIERLSESFDEVVVTRGEHGARSRCRGTDYDVTSSSDVVVDTTGAGDAATGAYLGARLGGAAPRDVPRDGDGRVGGRGRGARRGRLVAGVGDAVGGRCADPTDETGDDGDRDQVREHLQDVDRDRHLVRLEVVGEIDR